MKVNNSSIPDAQAGSLETYLREVREIPFLTGAQEYWLLRRMRDDEPRWASEARTELLLAHLRLVVAIARRYQGRGLPLEDLIQEGTLGLEAAVDNFDRLTGNRVATYADWKIRSAIDRALANTARTIRVPVNVLRKLSRIDTAKLKLRQELERDPTIEEMSMVTGYSIEDLAQLPGITLPAVSLDDLREDHDASWDMRIADESVKAPDEQCIEAEARDHLPHALDRLRERERTVVVRRFGLEGREPETLEEIATELRVSRERIRQIEDEALAKLRGLLEKPRALKRSALPTA